MTQAFNLSQLANNVNTAGLLDAADGLSGLVPLANGGTGSTNTINSVVAGSGISISTTGTQATVTSLATGTVVSVATGNGLSGGPITTSGTLSIACPSFASVGSYAFVSGGYNTSYTSGSNYSLLAASFQISFYNITSEYPVVIDFESLPGTWKWMSATTTATVNYRPYGIACRIA